MRSITWDDRPRCAILQRRLHSRNLELERYVQQNGKIPISITLGADKPIILPHVVWFSNTIDVLTRDTFSVPCLKLADVPLEYIEVIKSDLQETTIGISRSSRTLNKHVPTYHTDWSNQGPIRLLERDSLTTTVAGPSRSYNDNMTSLNNVVR
ncbi:(R)-mandelonitrile lyase 1-like [Cucumis melo var. makuwa]|uniref:(R)-mandelonitrile lyase 1-like n=1 Tax=Cucumis melo var. makuwa TaxID=1194695 RepID=A0A5D3BDM1_CUCMM|nr:(R)-mandelonitrile lyase 1-like [Cucumis melo var. makuwa]